MAASSGDSSFGEHVSKESPLIGRMPAIPPLSAEMVRPDAKHAGDVDPIPEGQSQPVEAEDVQKVHPSTTQDYMPNIGTSSPAPATVSAAEQIEPPAQSKVEGTCPSKPEGSDYFAPKTPEGSNVTDFAQKTVPTPSASSKDYSPASKTRYSLIGNGLEENGSSWRDLSTETAINRGFAPGSTRPTSVPNFQSRRREGADYPTYPNQSFAALHSQIYPPIYSPSLQYTARTGSSNPPHTFSASSIDVQTVTKDNPHPSSGSKTVGNTPAQSPSLFTPPFANRTNWAGGSDDGRSNTPMLHPTHHKAPKETHKLLKDYDPMTGRKIINHYEILQKLGSGQHGTVKQGRDLDSGSLVAIKIVRRFSKTLRLGRSGDPNDMIKKEVAILKKARHPHVVSLIEVIDDDEFGKVYLVLEYVEKGEIVWRKKTDKDIALFEMHRTKRERAGNTDEAFEKAEVERFNLAAPARREEKARLLENQKAQARKRLEEQRVQGHGQRSNLDPYWSLEFAGESDNDCGTYESESLHQAESQHSDESQTVMGHLPTDPTDGSPQSDTPSHTPKPLPHPIDPDQASATASSRPDTPANLEGTMWGPYVEESSPDLAFQVTLNEIIACQSQWTAEEEDYRYVPCLTLGQAFNAFQDTVLGLEYLHYQGIIHRDIKPANLLWNDHYRVKISDFGVSYLGKPIREDDNNEEIAEADPTVLDEAIELAKTVGTPAFYAPELCDPQYFEVGQHPERPAITGQIDVWALGVTLYAMIFGRLPFVHTNEFQMYEKIAREEVFIPTRRLKGVEHTDKTPSDNDKRMDDILEYEEVDDVLRDLLKRLLHKHPARRMTLKEVKHHPWMLRNIANPEAWLYDTDPSRQSEGKKIEVSTQEVQDAVVGLTVFDRVKAGFQRVGSVLRARGSRKRAESNPKHPESSSSSSAIKASTKEQRRTSLRGDEQIFSALRASREGSEHHPLAQSVAASPDLAKQEQNTYFQDDSMRPASEPQKLRPGIPDRTLSTADSMKTIRGHAPAASREAISLPQTLVPSEEFSSLTTVADPNSSSSSSLGGIFGGAGRRFVNSMRSRERVGRHSPSQSSRSSSVDTNMEDPHASPSLAISSAIAAGHVDQPPALREEPEPHRVPYESTTESFNRAQEQNHRRAYLETLGPGRRSTMSQAVEVPCPPSPDDETFYAQQRPLSEAGSTSAFAISSSSDQIVSGESTAHSRIPSVVSGASSLSATIEEDYNAQQLAFEKQKSGPSIRRGSGSRSHQQAESEGLNPTPALAKAAAEEEAGYNGEGEQDSDSEDEGLAMA